jgi:hypothetical protein
MPLRQARVIEIVGGVARHAQLFHHSPRPAVRRNREGNYLRKLQVVESETENGLSAFRGQSLSRKLSAQTPIDLDAWGEVCFKGRVDYSDEAHELTGSAQFGGEERQIP